ncbi:tautomerase family protein [Pseudonocardia spinosispora]|uniref:tautomerase family protein n=1 Tax=Pseudonocardia spinosispora TaxID=103441 RepID=UPI000429819A|nr:tautomerase family protein [Pseudonocardia spinosispora]
MPTYVCHSDASLLTGPRRADLARRITSVHSVHTGAPSSFAQVAFREWLPDGHYIGGRAADPRSVWVIGHIRAGRDASVRNRLALGVRDAVVEVAGVAAEFVWVYLTELPPGDMIEFGHPLPEPGAEQAWVDALPPPLRDRLRELDRGAGPQTGT